MKGDGRITGTNDHNYTALTVSLTVSDEEALLVADVGEVHRGSLPRKVSIDMSRSLRAVMDPAN